MRLKNATDSKALDEEAWIFWKIEKPARQNEILNSFSKVICLSGHLWACVSMWSLASFAREPWPT